MALRRRKGHAKAAGSAHSFDFKGLLKQRSCAGQAFFEGIFLQTLKAGQAIG